MEFPTNSPTMQAGSNNRRAMNSTAYRIYKLLHWLMEAPLSVPALNEKFCADPLIGKPLSTDSIWLYVNTLKALGCKIRRPSPKNCFCYELLSHPFGLHLTDRHFDILSQAKAYAQQHFSHQEVLTLDRLLKKIVSQSAQHSAKEAIEQLFAKSRSYDYQESEAHLRRLEDAIEREDLLQLTYSSPMRGKEVLTFLPERLFYEQGVVYVRGERIGQPDPSNLRLERILGILPLQDEETRQALLRKREQTCWVHLQLRLAEDFSAEDFQGFGLSENQGVYEEHIEARKDEPVSLVRLRVRETFYLKQRLLACEYPFQILEPSSLREDLQKTLEAMWRIYRNDNTESG
jgi:predicted DNA-binding transcriptional regulator YafY